MSKRHLITSALPYANGPLHIGHIAGAYLPADIYTRYLRAKVGHENVLHVCGSDEHGAAISMKAIKEKTTPQEIVNKYHGINKKAFEEFGIDFDIYHRTSAELHHKTAQDFFLALYEKGVFKKVENEQMYDPEAKQFLADRFIMGTCPNCQSERAYGDQCENCGKTLSPTELINPHSTLSGAQPELKKTWHFCLPMGDHAGWIEEFIRDGRLNGEPHHNSTNWRKQVVGQCLSWVESGLGDRAMTRDLDWGGARTFRRCGWKSALRLAGCTHWIHLSNETMGNRSGKSRSLEKMVAGQGFGPCTLYWQGQHCFSLYHFSNHFKGTRWVQFTSECSCK